MRRGMLVLGMALVMGATACSLRSRSSLEPAPVAPSDRLLEAVVQPPAAPGVSAPRDAGTRYRIQPGDRLQVSFPAGPELGFEALVRPDGYISSPLYGDLRADGLTPGELAGALERTYAADVRDPRAVVSMLAMQPRWVYVFGEVARPDRYEYDPRSSLIGLLSQAGGTKVSAQLRNVVVLHVKADSTYSYDLVDLSALLESNSASAYYLDANDIVLVPRTVITDIRLFVDQYINTFLPPIDSFIRGRYYWKLATGDLNN